MKIGLIDVDSHNFPNLPLMKISAYHKRQGDDVEFWMPINKYDIVYKSKVFDFTPDIEYYPQAEQIIEGGTGYNITSNLPCEIEHIMPDNSLYPRYDEAYGFLTRGCPRKCKFCIVSQKEGCVSKQVADLKEFYAGQKIIKLLDPNLLACKERERILEQLIEPGAGVDFTQGLDIRLLDKDTIQLLNRVKTKNIHFAWDNPQEDLLKHFETFAKHSIIKDRGRRSVYVLTNFNSSHEDDLIRIYALKKMEFSPYVMIYNKENAPRITKDLQRWVNNRRIFYKCNTFEEYVSGRG